MQRDLCLFFFKCYICTVKNTCLPSLVLSSDMSQSICFWPIHFLLGFCIRAFYTFYWRRVFLFYICVCLLNNAIISPEFHEKSGAHEKAGLNLLYCSYGVFCIKTVVGLLGSMFCSFVTSWSMLTSLTIPIYVFTQTHTNKKEKEPLLLLTVHMFNLDLSTSLYT